MNRQSESANRAPSLGSVPPDMYLTHLNELLIADSDTYSGLRIEVSEIYHADGRIVKESRLIARAQGALATVSVSGGGMLDWVEPGEAVPYRVAKILMQALDEVKREYYTEATND